MLRLLRRRGPCRALLILRPTARHPFVWEMQPCGLQSLAIRCSLHVVTKQHCSFRPTLSSLPLDGCISHSCSYLEGDNMILGEGERKVSITKGDLYIPLPLDCWRSDGWYLEIVLKENSRNWISSFHSKWDYCEKGKIPDACSPCKRANALAWFFRLGNCSTCLCWVV